MILAAWAVSAARAHGNAIEQAAALQALPDEILQADPEREHGYERCYAHRDAQDGERIAEDGLAQTVRRQFTEICQLSFSGSSSQNHMAIGYMVR